MNLFSKGNVIAGAVAALFACGGGDQASNAPTTPGAAKMPAPDGPAAADDGSQGGAKDHQCGAPRPATGQVKCSGINECRGKAECHGEAHSCAGQNECKGKGWIMASADECAKKNGTVIQ